MAISAKNASHPGSYVRENIIPDGMSVKEAAKRLGVGRQALSNFLNGKSALSSAMAVRLEKAFGADRKRLLDMQAAYDQGEWHSGEKGLAVRAFVPNFLTIKARQIEDWADRQLDARALLPVFLRKLVHSTGNDLLHVDFPGYDNAQRKGSDGFVEAGAATPWVPEGRSYWEFGTTKSPRSKAKHDYEERLKSIDATERAKSTYVFVTPHNWPGKQEWVKEKSNTGDWKVVRAFDASDLEQWLEQSIPAQIWLAEQLTLPSKGYETLEQAWYRWATASEPHLTSKIFEPSFVSHRDTFKSWLENPSDKPFVVTADSRDEALAFLACLFDNDEELWRFKDRAAIFTSPETLRTLIASSVPFIPIVYSEDTERELANVYRQLHCVVIRPRNTVGTNVDVALDLLDYDSFEKALTEMGVEESDIDRLARESGRSPTILRRRLSKNAAIQTPEWARDNNSAKLLVPMALAGTWNADQEADREIMSYMMDRKYEVIENDLAYLLQFDDCPVWSAGHYRGVASKIDVLFAIANIVTSADIDRFFYSAEHVLSESDPSLDLPEKDRWAAALYGKKRDHSNAMREGFCETLVILSVHGNSLFQSRLGIDIKGQVAALIHKLLTPLTLEKLLSHDRDLPHYAEAAPEEFLKIVEEDQLQDVPALPGLLKPVDSSLWASPSRTGLLWALECLAWKPQNLMRVLLILAQLSEYKIDDNWANRPIASLQAILRSWMPQTAATVEQRIKALESLTKRYPDIGWEVCLEQVKPGSRMGTYNYRPRWRSDASGAGQVVTHKELHDFTRKALDLLIAWPTHNENTLGDLVESLQGMLEEDQVKIWGLIDKWSQNADEPAKASLRERIRRYALSRRGRRKLEETTQEYARKTYDQLLPDDLVLRHRWLFTDQWVEESADELEDEEFDFRQREERIDKLRREATDEIWTEYGFTGIERLITNSRAAGLIGHYVASHVADTKSRVDFIQRCLTLDGEKQGNAEWCLQGFLGAIDDESRTELLQAAAKGFSTEEKTRLFVCAPFQATTWSLLDDDSVDIRIAYWKDVPPQWGRHTPAELTELIDRLLEAKRPRAAFHAVQMDFKEIETSRLKQLLNDIATVNAEPTGHFKLDSYHISGALDSLNSRADITCDEMAQLEFLFIDALDHSEYGIPNLEKQIAQSPSLFVQAISLVYRRSDEGEDPPEWEINNLDQRAAIASAAYRLLDKIKKIPGEDENGKIEARALIAWISEVRRMCGEYGRAEIGDHCLGQLLSKAPTGENGIWPCEAVCEAMEEIASIEIGKGFSIGARNSRGVHWRGKGGDQERELAMKYRSWAERLHFDFPYVGGILEGIAESYDHEASWQDSEARIANRLRY